MNVKGDCEERNSAALLRTALRLARKRVVVKRPLKGPAIRLTVCISTSSLPSAGKDDSQGVAKTDTSTTSDCSEQVVTSSSGSNSSKEVIVKPNYSLEGSSQRFDVYLIP